MSKTICDLIYDDRFRVEFAKQYPLATIEDASDFVHESRFGVRLPADVSEHDYHFFLLRVGAALSSLHFGLAMYEKTKELKQIVDEWKKTTTIERDFK